MTKPFSVEELLARLRVTQRRLATLQTGMLTSGAVFTNGKLKVDYAAGCAFLDGQELHLTPSEYKLLCLLCKNLGKVLTHTFITQQIWGRSWENDVASLQRIYGDFAQEVRKRTGLSSIYPNSHWGRVPYAESRIILSGSKNDCTAKCFILFIPRGLHVYYPETDVNMQKSSAL